MDRIGDTFRWKGANVSSGDVRAFALGLVELVVGVSDTCPVMIDRLVRSLGSL